MSGYVNGVQTTWEQAVGPSRYHNPRKPGNAKIPGTTFEPIVITNSQKYPTTSSPDWSNLSVLHRNTLYPRAWFYNYTSEKEALSRDVTKSQIFSLSGTWKFHLTPYPLEPASEFFAPGFDTSAWDDIAVPGMWQLQGHGKGPQYTNVNFPWPVNPPHIPFDDNETGHYVRTFRVPQSFRGMQVRLRFEGVDSGFHVWVNGKEVGYSQGARNPSEWDVSEFVEWEGENTLAARVYQRCDGTYLEDQVCFYS
jgi:beta-galactosidase